MDRTQQIAITGATGFVGKALLSNLSKDFAIKAIDLRSSPPHQLSLSGVGTLVHCAALVHQMGGAPREDYFRINTTLTEDLARHARSAGVRHFIFLSTSHVYGEYGDCFHHEKSFDENDECRPMDPYGESKLSAENAIFQLTSEAFTVTVIRAPLVYGEGAKGNLKSLSKLVKSFPLLPFADARNRRSLIYIDNLVHFIRRTIETRTGGLLLAQDEYALSIQQIVLLLAKGLGVRVWLFRLPQPLFNFAYWLMPEVMKRLYGTLALNSRLSNAKIGYKAPVSSEEGFRRMVRSNAESPQP